MIRQSFTRRRFLGTGLAAVGAISPWAASPRRHHAALGHGAAARHPSVAMMDRVAKEVKEKTGGASRSRLFPGGQLGSRAT